MTERQLARYRQMSGEQRLEIGFRLWEFAREFIAESIRNEHPDLSAQELQQRVIGRMQS